MRQHAADAVINQLYLDRAGQSMATDAFAEIWRKGRALTLAEALAEAQAVDWEPASGLRPDLEGLAPQA